MIHVISCHIMSYHVIFCVIRQFLIKSVGRRGGGQIFLHMPYATASLSGRRQKQGMSRICYPMLWEIRPSVGFLVSVWVGEGVDGSRLGAPPLKSCMFPDKMEKIIRISQSWALPRQRSWNNWRSRSSVLVHFAGLQCSANSQSEVEIILGDEGMIGHTGRVFAIEMERDVFITTDNEILFLTK
jgi:hypothetical protein